MWSKIRWIQAIVNKQCVYKFLSVLYSLLWIKSEIKTSVTPGRIKTRPTLLNTLASLWKTFIWNASLLISNTINSIIRDDYNEQSKQQEMALSWGSFAGSPPPPNTYKRASQACVMNKGPPTVSLRIVFPMLAHCVYCSLSWWWMSDYSAASVSLTKRRWLWEQTPNTHTHTHHLQPSMSWPTASLTSTSLISALMC